MSDGERVLVTTLTKRMSEDLVDYLRELGIKAKYLHSDINAIERVEILRGLRRGDFDVLVGINLLREGLDLVEVSLVAILDADKEGFLRSTRSLIQTMGRAARNIRGRVILYADKETQSIKEAVGETNRRRKIQAEFNAQHGIVPASARRSLEPSLSPDIEEYSEVNLAVLPVEVPTDEEGQTKLIADLKAEMLQAAKEKNFEHAARLRDTLIKLQTELLKV